MTPTRRRIATTALALAVLLPLSACNGGALDDLVRGVGTAGHEAGAGTKAGAKAGAGVGTAGAGTAGSYCYANDCS